MMCRIWRLFLNNYLVWEFLFQSLRIVQEKIRTCLLQITDYNGQLLI